MYEKGGKKRPGKKNLDVKDFVKSGGVPRNSGLKGGRGDKFLLRKMFHKKTRKQEKELKKDS